MAIKLGIPPYSGGRLVENDLDAVAIAKPMQYKVRQTVLTLNAGTSHVV